MDSELSQFSQFPRAPVETANTLRSKAKSYMIQSGVHGLMADRIVECIVAAAVCEALDQIKRDAAINSAAGAEARRG